jgi:hypothetical protein
MDYIRVTTVEHAKRIAGLPADEPPPETKPDTPTDLQSLVATVDDPATLESIVSIVRDYSAMEATHETINRLTGAGLSKPKAIEIMKLARKPSGKRNPGLPSVRIPEGEQTITSCGVQLGKLLAKDCSVYNRGGWIAKVTKDDQGKPQIVEIKPAALASTIESVARLYRVDTKGVNLPTILSEGKAKLIASCDVFQATLPYLKLIAPCPVITEHDGKLVEVHGYDRKTGIYADGQKPEKVTLKQAVEILKDAVSGFQYADEADRSRAIAAMITPALVFGGLLKGRAPIDLSEANDSQTGKGYRAKLVTSIYNQGAKVITQGSNGVGGLEEQFSSALIKGSLFILMDNVRGKIDSQAFESFLTEDHFTARASFLPNTDIDPRRVCVMMTSNKADLTKDLSNRCACVRILKQPDGHHYKEYPEGDILEHIRANQPKYLGAVFAVIRHWHAKGCPKSTETGHDFRAWAQTLDWIISNIFGGKPMLEGHRDTQERMTNPALSWLRDVAIEAIRQDKTETFWRAYDLIDMLSETQIEIPGMKDHDDVSDETIRKQALQTIGRRMGQCFRKGDKIRIDGMVIERRECYVPSISKNVKEYAFFGSKPDNESIGGFIGGNGQNEGKKALTECETENAPSSENGSFPPIEADFSAYSPPIALPIKPLIFPISPDTPLMSMITKPKKDPKNSQIKSPKGVSGGIGGNSLEIDPEDWCISELSN